MEAVSVGPVEPVQLVYAAPFPAAGEAPARVLLYNADITRPVYVADNQSIDSGSVQIPPLTPVVVDGTIDMFGITLANGTVRVYRIPGGELWGPSPAQVAEQISLAGITGGPSQFLFNFGTITPGSSWGPDNINISSSGRYLLYLQPDASGDPFATDITITHFDAFANPIFTEFMTVSNVAFPGGTVPILIQGNVLGAGVTVSGNSAASAWLNAVTGSSGLVAANFTARLSLIPIPLGESEPKIIGLYSGYSAKPTAYPGSGATLIGPFGAFAGRAGVTIEASSGAGPGYIRLQSFQVAAGTSPVNEQRIALPTNASNTQAESLEVDMAIPPMFIEGAIFFSTATGGTVAITVQPYQYD